MESEIKSCELGQFGNLDGVKILIDYVNVVNVLSLNLIEEKNVDLKNVMWLVIRWVSGLVAWISAGSWRVCDW